MGQILVPMFNRLVLYEILFYNQKCSEGRIGMGPQNNLSQQCQESGQQPGFSPQLPVITGVSLAASSLTTTSQASVTCTAVRVWQLIFQYFSGYSTGQMSLCLTPGFLLLSLA